MVKRFLIFTFCFCSLLGILSCNSDDDTLVDTATEEALPAISCDNVIIFNDFAYGACGGVIEIVNLSNGARNRIAIAANDIAVDQSNATLFVQATNTIHALSISDPFTPRVIATSATNFGSFSGIDAANGVVVVSGGNRSNNTQVYRFDGNRLNLTANGIPSVDSVMGNPDVHVIPTTNGLRAFYSQDLNAVTNWGIQIVDFNTNGTVQSTEAVIELNTLRFPDSFELIAPASFPLESEFLNNRLYVGHFAINGIEVIDFNTENTLRSTIDLGYQPINITTDGTSLFIVGTTRNVLSIVNPNTNVVDTQVIDEIQQARGVAANANFIVIADRQAGLLVINR